MPISQRLVPLLQPLAHDSTVPDSRKQANQVHQAREAMDPPKLLVEGHHLLGMRWSIIALLPITGFYEKSGRLYT